VWSLEKQDFLCSVRMDQGVRKQTGKDWPSDTKEEVWRVWSLEGVLGWWRFLPRGGTEEGKLCWVWGQVCIGA
jgi:hypothetical protein